MSKQTRRKIGGRQAAGKESVAEMKGLFIVALAVIQEVKMNHHTVIHENVDTHEDEHTPTVTFVKSLVHYGKALEQAMGSNEFYLWLDGFLHASAEEKAAMWENGDMSPI